MTEAVTDTFYLDENSVAHRVSSIGYSEDGESVSTFCSEEFDIEDREELFNVPIKLLSHDEVCVECERNHSHIQYDRFNFDDESGSFKFFIRASLRVGENKGFVVSETVEADSREEAERTIEEDYEQATVHKYYYISRSEEYGDWDVLLDETMNFDDS